MIAALAITGMSLAIALHGLNRRIAATHSSHETYPSGLLRAVLIPALWLCLPVLIAIVFSTLGIWWALGGIILAMLGSNLIVMAIGLVAGRAMFSPIAAALVSLCTLLTTGLALALWMHANR